MYKYKDGFIKSFIYIYLVVLAGVVSYDFGMRKKIEKQYEDRGMMRAIDITANTNRENTIKPRAPENINGDNTVKGGMYIGNGNNGGMYGGNGNNGGVYGGNNEPNPLDSIINGNSNNGNNSNNIGDQAACPPQVVINVAGKQ